MTIVDSRRKAIAREVVRIAKSSHNADHLVEAVRKKYRRSQYIAGGCHRMVYSLPYNLVLKVDKDEMYSWGDLKNNGNQAEVATSKVKKLKPYIVPILGHHLGEGVKVIVARRAVVPTAKDIDGKYRKSFDDLSDKFADCHYQNVGVLNGRLLMIDTGCEAYAEAA